MWLPTQYQVKAGTRNIAAGVGMAIAAFGLSTKIDPETITAIVNSLGSLVSDTVTFIGLITPFVTMYYAAKSASSKAQAVAITKELPGTKVVTTQAVAEATPEAPNVVSMDDHKVVTK